MRALVLSPVFILCFFGGSNAVTIKRGRQNPVSGVVDLLQGLSKKVAEEGKAEEDLYETYVCWAKSIIDAKTESNRAAEQRIDELKTYVSDIENGRIEFTSERTDLQKEIADLTSEIDAAEATRSKETDDFSDAKDEMDKAIEALESAIDVLKEATKPNKAAALLAMKTRLHESAAVRAKHGAAFNRAVALGQQFLSGGDALFLQRLLTADVPDRASWKKLNRKATFKQGYKARSGKIQGILKNLLETFSANLADAVKKEEEAQALFQKLLKSKTDQRDAAREALDKMDKEKGAAAMSSEEAQEEIDSLTQQRTDDKKYIKQVTDALAEKKEEWGERQRVRSGELAAISKAIEILHNDDARDLMKKSFDSQGYLFLQVARTSTSAKAHEGVVTALRSAARTTADKRLLAIAELARGSHFDAVLEAIDSMISVLKEEEEDDLKKKEDCENLRSEETRKAIKSSRTIDELSDTITGLQSKIEEAMKQIEASQAEIDQIEKEMAEAKKLREEEHAEYKKDKKDDETALQTVKDAKAVLEDFYKEEGLMFVQQPSQAGQAPPPPPNTWEQPYGGKTQESNGIISILDMVIEDIGKDISKADAEEGKAKELYEKTKGDDEDEMKSLNDLIGELNSTKGEAATDLETAIKTRLDEKNTLNGHVDTVEKAEPGCNFFVINYNVRRANRHIEMDGLMKAKAVLKGGTFETTDENREMKPGDAFLQRRRS